MRSPTESVEGGKSLRIDNESHWDWFKVGNKEDAVKRAQEGTPERQRRGEKQKSGEKGFMEGSVPCIKLFNLC